MTRHGRRWGLMVIALVAVTAVAVSSCGRKGDLEPPRAALAEAR